LVKKKKSETDMQASALLQGGNYSIIKGDNLVDVFPPSVGTLITLPGSQMKLKKI
jgi:hypothetical protein